MHIEAVKAHIREIEKQPLKPVHVMGVARRSAFILMKRQSDKFARRTGPMLTYFEREVMGREMALTLERLGWLRRSPGRSGRLGTITLTEFGLWVMGGVTP